MSLADILEGAASALPGDADAIRPANGDPFQLIDSLDAEGASRVLAWVLANDPDSGAELGAAWADVDGGPEVLTSLDEGALPKQGRKALRKVMHRLRSQGIALPAKEKAEPVVARLPKIEDDLGGAFVSALDPRGARLVYLVEPNPSGGARLFEVLLDENRGIVDFEVYSAGRSRIRGFVKEAVKRSRFPAVSVEPAALRALVARIAERHPADRAEPASYGEWRSKMAVPGTTPGDQVADALGTSVGEGDALARAVELVQEGVVGPWGPPAKELSALVEARLEEEAAREPGQEDWAEIAAPVYGGDQAEVNTLRFRESAYVLWKLEREEDARACLCAAEAFTTKPASENPVAATMAEVLLAPALEASRSRAASGAGEAEGESAGAPASDPDGEA
jgi:hypothetical protein